MIQDIIRVLKTRAAHIRAGLEIEQEIKEKRVLVRICRRTTKHLEREAFKLFQRNPDLLRRLANEQKLYAIIAIRLLIPGTGLRDAKRMADTLTGA